MQTFCHTHVMLNVLVPAPVCKDCTGRVRHQFRACACASRRDRYCSRGARLAEYMNINVQCGRSSVYSIHVDFQYIYLSYIKQVSKKFMSSLDLDISCKLCNKIQSIRLRGLVSDLFDFSKHKEATIRFPGGCPEFFFLNFFFILLAA